MDLDKPEDSYLADESVVLIRSFQKQQVTLLPTLQYLSFCTYVSDKKKYH